jgi:hypothetical protein
MSAVAVAAMTGCTREQSFRCTSDDHCLGRDGTGVCQPEGFCSFPDPDCGSGQRFGAHADFELGGMCVPEHVDTDSTTTDTTITTVSDAGTSATTTSSPTDGTTTVGVDSMGPTTTAETTDATGRETGSTGDPITVDVPADVAACNDPVSLDLVTCAADEGPNSITVDAMNADFGQEPTTGWLRFVLPGEVSSMATVDSVTLVLTTGLGVEAGGPESGEVWQVESFDMTSLTTAQPAQIEMVAPDQGLHDLGAEVEWSLPTSIVDSSPVHLGLYADQSDGSAYDDNNGAVPPRLVVVGR